MPMKKLVNVVPLSRTHCDVPIQGKLMYATRDNFVGQVIDGYSPNAQDVCLLMPHAARALCDVQNTLIRDHNLALIIHDAYRPLRAVKHFRRWYKQAPLDDHEMACKAKHYPNLEKTQLESEGYLAKHVSQHCYAQAVDVVLIDLVTGSFVDMGACFDYLGELSHHSVLPPVISQRAYEYRQILKQAMAKHGFDPYEKEFWHYNFNAPIAHEPFDVLIARGVG